MSPVNAVFPSTALRLSGGSLSPAVVIGTTSISSPDTRPMSISTIIWVCALESLLPRAPILSRPKSSARLWAEQGLEHAQSLGLANLTSGLLCKGRVRRQKLSDDAPAHGLKHLPFALGDVREHSQSNIRLGAADVLGPPVDYREDGRQSARNEPAGEPLRLFADHLLAGGKGWGPRDRLGTDC